MKLSKIGSDYGGWTICLDLIPYGSTIISAGVGEDITFDEGLVNLKNCSIIGIDPTLKSIKYIEENDPASFTLLEKALWVDDGGVKLYHNTNPSHVSESVLDSHHATGESYHECESITLPQVLSKYPNISLIKMDVEGAEYAVLNSLGSLDIPQVCVEFHGFCTDKTNEDTLACVEKMDKLGYAVVHVTSTGREVSFCRKDLI